MPEQTTIFCLSASTLLNRVDAVGGGRTDVSVKCIFGEQVDGRLREDIRPRVIIGSKAWL